MENREPQNGKAIVCEMVDSIVRKFREVDDGDIVFYYPPVGDVRITYEDLAEYEAVAVRYAILGGNLFNMDISDSFMVSNICKAKSSSCQYAGYLSSALHDVLIPVNSPQRNEIFKRELERVIETVLNVQQFQKSNSLHLVSQKYRDLLSDLLNV